ncbi:beta-galactosidase trimerization domain-containing protein [Paenibacillus sonchi]|uniref:Beta-galactosidase trimerization domain-containing protein n=2 Tax=Paenibacillus sonchi TaxID=373687 RepID=A0A974P6V5_9BACL|nr:beta-galactosidase trimerization domain-containing protein [Paenibacillus sonchi]QQZ58564.1 beta-galactosidase trimerization domain-containing protein [Paenibacillus sonchi]
MRFRQVHLDYHTSEAITPIGARFDKKQFQEMLKLGNVDSVTVFSKCHHGWAYHPSEANEIHPGLSFDLLGAQIEAAHEINVKTPVYLSAGLDEKLARRHPEWLIRDENDQTNWVKGFLEPGYHQFCMNTPYLDILIAQTREVVSRYDLDGLFFDIVGVRKCYCHSCIESVRREGGDPRDEQAMRRLWERTYANYTARVKEAAEAIKPGLPIFHNGGHIARGRRDLAFMNDHLELESLPTGGWGYDHFPLSARYAQTLGVQFLGMTGKFHTSWGEFGGYKHPNALRYETALSIANGAGCSIGDQLHPDGHMDEATYALIGEAYREVERKEAWCTQATNVADIALLSLEAAGVHPQAQTGGRKPPSDAGAARILLEGKFLFDVIDKEHDFTAYKVLILPDYVAVDEGLRGQLELFLQQGGKILATGWSGLDPEGTQFAVDFGARHVEANPYRPDYFRPAFKPGSLQEASFIFYAQGQKIELAGGTELGRREDPYFNRDVFTFCSHQHSPSSYTNGGPGMVENGNGIYIAWNVFEDYAAKGSLIVKETVLHALNRLLPDKTLHTNLPAQGVVTLQEQKEEKRLVNHLLYASPVRRGENIEVIEDIIPLYDVQVSVRTEGRVQNVYLAPQMTPLSFSREEQNVHYTVPVLECHQMVVLDYE